MEKGRTEFDLQGRPQARQFGGIASAYESVDLR